MQYHVSVDHGTPLDPGTDFSEWIGTRDLPSEARMIMLKLGKYDTMAFLCIRDLTSVNGRELKTCSDERQHLVRLHLCDICKCA